MLDEIDEEPGKPITDAPDSARQIVSAATYDPSALG